jgi:hypothetical protein
MLLGQFRCFCLAPHSVCTKLIGFLWSEGVLGAAVLQRLSAEYGNTVLPQWNFYEWIEKCKMVAQMLHMWKSWMPGFFLPQVRTTLRVNVT